MRASVRSYRDLVRAFRRDFSEPPDWVAFPESEQAVIDLLDWCGSKNIAAIPFGGGSSVVGGVECNVGDGYAGVVSIDLTRLNQVVEIDRVSRAARIQAGIYGPALEDALRPQGLTLRHFPQSFEFSTLGGWLATRAGGHFATRYTHIDDFTESLRVVTPSGIIESRRLPGSGAGPSPDRLFLGSEGSFGIITEAWMRLQDRPSCSIPPKPSSRPVARETQRFSCWPSSPRTTNSMPGWRGPWRFVGSMAGTYPMTPYVREPMRVLLVRGQGAPGEIAS